jgi:NTE family protein
MDAQPHAGASVLALRAPVARRLAHLQNAAMSTEATTMRRSICWTVAGLLAWPSSLYAAPERRCHNTDATDRPRIGLVLGGGGARGAAHIGVIRRLEELRVPIDYVTGTSIGSLVGAFYATGMSAGELDETIRGIDFDALFKDATPRKDLTYRRKRDDDLGLFGPKLGVGPKSQLLPRGAVHGQKISYLFETLTASRVRTHNFDELPIPYRAIAADIVTGRAVVIGDGALSVAMRASMSVPGVFDPVERGEDLLVDGGIANNLPIDVARSLGAERVIAVDVGTPLSTRDELRTLVNFTGQLSSLLIVRNAEAQIATLGPGDVLIRPALGQQISAASFDRVDDAIPIGYAAAQAADEALARLSVSETEYAAFRARVAACVDAPPKVQFVEIDNRSRFSDEVIERRVRIDVDRPLDESNLERSITDVYALGFIDVARYEMVERDDETGVRIRVDQDSRGTRFLEWGLDIVSDGDDATINLRAGLLKTDLDEYGSELRLLAQIGDTPVVGAEAYKYLDPGLRWVLRPRATVEWRDLRRYDDRGNPEQIVDITQFTGEMLLLRELGRRSAVMAGLRYLDGETEVDLGELPHEKNDFDAGEYVVRYNFDGVDDRYFPGSGSYASIAYVNSDDSLGSDDTYEQINSSLLTARTFGRHTLIGNVRYATTLSGSAPFYALFRAGGLFNLSGLNEDEISGSHYGIGLASWRYQVGSGFGFFPAFAGISAEYGNASDERDDLWDDGIGAGSLYFGYRSPIGPLYWGFGVAEGGNRTYFLRIGDPFGRSTIGR